MVTLIIYAFFQKHVDVKRGLFDFTRPPATTPPSTTQPATTQPATTQPVTTQPATTQPATTQPATTQPVTTQPATNPVNNSTQVNNSLNHHYGVLCNEISLHHSLHSLVRDRLLIISLIHHRYLLMVQLVSLSMCSWEQMSLSLLGLEPSSNSVVSKL